MEQENAYVKYISTLISKHLQDDLTPIEEKELDQWIAADPENKILFDQINDPQNLENSFKDILHYDTEKLLDRVKSRINTSEIQLVGNRKQRTSFTRYIAIAATVLIALSYTAYLYLQNTSIENQELIAHQIIPGGNKATLTFADGTTVDLSENQNGIIIGDEHIKYTDGSALVIPTDLHVSSTEAEKSVRMLTLTTPKGGQYQVVLPDGTKVWLNAASSLNYPSNFVGSERRVELNGEAYFEVATQLQKNFIVTSNGQEVKVLGTHFNINAYEDEISTKTTLLEGSVQVSSLSNNSIILIPGQQSEITKSGTLSVKNIDASSAVAWKEGLFSFKNEDIQSIMKQFERWYNIEVVYEGISPQTTFSGKIYRSEQIEKVYALLNFYKIDYEVKGRQIKIKGN